MARTFKDIEEQMASVGIYIPPGFELYANRDNWKRFKPRDSRFKRGKEAWFAIWEHSLSSGKNVNRQLSVQLRCGTALLLSTLSRLTILTSKRKKSNPQELAS